MPPLLIDYVRTCCLHLICVIVVVAFCSYMRICIYIVCSVLSFALYFVFSSLFALISLQFSVIGRCSVSSHINNGTKWCEVLRALNTNDVASSCGGPTACRSNIFSFVLFTYTHKHIHVFVHKHKYTCSPIILHIYNRRFDSDSRVFSLICHVARALRTVRQVLTLLCALIVYYRVLRHTSLARALFYRSQPLVRMTDFN